MFIFIHTAQCVQLFNTCSDPRAISPNLGGIGGFGEMVVGPCRSGLI